MSGRADKTSRIYVKHYTLTGKTVAVMLRNPITYEKQGEVQIALQNRFHALSKGATAFYNRIRADDASVEDRALLASLEDVVRSQHRYATVRGFIMAMCAHVSDDFSEVIIRFRDHEEVVRVSFTARKPGDR